MVFHCYFARDIVSQKFEKILKRNIGNVCRVCLACRSYVQMCRALNNEHVSLLCAHCAAAWFCVDHLRHVDRCRRRRSVYFNFACNDM